MKFLACLVLLCSACAGQSAATVTRNSLTVAADIQVSGQEAWKQWNVGHQRAIIEKGRQENVTVVEIDKRLAEYRVIQGQVDLAFHTLAAATVATKGTVDLIDGGKLDVSALAPAIAILLQAGLALRDVVMLAGFSLPQLDALLGEFGVAVPPKSTWRWPLYAPLVTQGVI
jgi:hypothetical protein